jgi:hypothetical protein
VSDRLATLRAALGFLALEPREPERRVLRQCSIPGAGSATWSRAMARRGLDREFRRYEGSAGRATAAAAAMTLCKWPRSTGLVT